MVYIVQASNSKLDNYRECPYKYYVRYHERMPEQRSDTAMAFGSYIHKVFELGLNCSSIEDLAKIAEEVKPTYKYDEDYDKVIPKCLKNFFEFNSKISKAQTVGTELNEELKIDDFAYIGIIDRVLKAEDGSIMIVDYKTSKREKNKLDLFTDKQLIGYAVTISKNWNVPINKITCGHFYPITGNFVYVTFQYPQVSKFIQDIKNEVWTIRKKSKTDFQPIRNRFCDWCGFKYLCPMFTDQNTITRLIREHKESVKDAVNKDKTEGNDKAKVEKTA
jgi:CRISPR/Cas system-associated exonuclease Cas4 (RecB family)